MKDVVIFPAVDAALRGYFRSVGSRSGGGLHWLAGSFLGTERG